MARGFSAFLHERPFDSRQSLDRLLEKMVNDPEKLADFTMDKSLDDAIDEAKSQITFRQEGAVKQKEMVR